MLAAEVVGEFEFGERTAASPARPRRLADLHPGAAPERACSSWRPDTPGRRLRWPRRRDRADPSHRPTSRRPVRRLGAHDDQFAGTQRAEELVGMVEQAADPAAERPERGRVAAADEADRPVDRLADRERAEDRCQGEAAGVDDDQGALAPREVLVAADASRSSGAAARPIDLTHEAGVAAPVVDHAGRFVDEAQGSSSDRPTARAVRRGVRSFIAAATPCRLADDARPAVEAVDHLGRRRLGHDAEQLGHATVVGEPAHGGASRRRDRGSASRTGSSASWRSASRVRSGGTAPVGRAGVACRQVIAPLATTLTGSARPTRAAATIGSCRVAVLDHGERRIGEHGERHDRLRSIRPSGDGTCGPSTGARRTAPTLTPTRAADASGDVFDLGDHATPFRRRDGSARSRRDGSVSLVRGRRSRCRCGAR